MKAPPPTIKKPERWQTHIYLDEADYKLLRKIADQESRSITMQVQHFLRIALREWKQ